MRGLELQYNLFFRGGFYLFGRDIDAALLKQMGIAELLPADIDGGKSICGI
jgi:hypothetical protein